MRQPMPAMDSMGNRGTSRRKCRRQEVGLQKWNGNVPVGIVFKHHGKKGFFLSKVFESILDEKCDENSF
jgi:hypothetical protein